MHEENESLFFRLGLNRGLKGCYQKTVAQSEMHRICTAALNEATFLAYLMEVPRHFFNGETYFLPTASIYIIPYRSQVVLYGFF